MSDQMTVFNARVREAFTWEKADEALKRFENLHWRRDNDHPRTCIPIQPDDDDIVLGEALRRGQAAEARLAALEAAGRAVCDVVQRYGWCEACSRATRPREGLRGEPHRDNCPVGALAALLEDAS